MSERITRRSVMRGAGAALALPWVESIGVESIGLESVASTAPANGEALAEPPLRMVFMYMPDGVRPDYWTPAADSEDYELTPYLKPVESLKSDFVLFENLWNAKTVGRNGHGPKVPARLPGGYVERTPGDDLDSGGNSADQFAAQRLGDRTALPCVELGLDTLRSGIEEPSFGDSTGPFEGLT